MSVPLTTLLRIAAMTAVIFIHVSAPWERAFAAGDVSALTVAAVVLNQAGRFCVPLFLVLSGYGLSLRYRQVPLTLSGYGGFIRRRFLKAAVPYIVWSTVFFLALFLLNSGTAAAGPADTAGRYLRDLLTGSADYHLYFMVILLQCYALFPLLVRFPAVPLLGGSGAALVLFAYPVIDVLRQRGLALPVLPSVFVGGWLFYFGLGIAAGRSRRADRSRSAVSVAAAAALLLAGVVIAEYIWRSRSGAPPGHYNHFNRVTVMGYTLALTGWVWCAAPKWEPLLRRPGIKRLLEWAAPLLMTVYFVHTLVLRLVRQTPLGDHVFAATAATWLGSLLAAVLMRKVYMWSKRTFIK